MEDSAPFASICTTLESLSGMTRMEARGTMRLALKEAGLEPHAVTTRALMVVIDKLMPDLLRTRGVADIPAVCAGLKARLTTDGPGQPTVRRDSPEDILTRFGRRK